MTPSIPMNWTQKQEDFMRSMPDLAAKILLWLLWTGGAYTGKELAMATNAAPNSVTAAMAWLDKRGLTQNNGRLNGWSLSPQLPLPFKQLWQGHSGVHLESGAFVSPTSGNDTAPSDSFVSPTSGNGTETADAPDNPAQIDRKICDLSPSLINCLINPDPDPELINQSINQSEIANCDLLRRVMAMTDPPIVNPTADKLLAAAVRPPHLLAWYWWTLTQEWIGGKVGYAINRVRRGEIPPAAYGELAHLWLSLDEDGRLDFGAVFYTGNYHAIASLQDDFGLSQAAAELAVRLPRRVFEEIT